MQMYLNHAQLQGNVHSVWLPKGDVTFSVDNCSKTFRQRQNLATQCL